MTTTPHLQAAGSPADLRLDAAAVEFQAAVAGRPPRLIVRAYSGGIMRVDPWGAVVVDLAGVKKPADVPFLMAHDPEQPIGHAERVTITGRAIDAEGPASGAGPAADEFLASAKNGFPWKASVGMQLGRRRYLRPGETVNVNGQDLVAPDDGLLLAETSTLIEISILALGADDRSSVTLAAKQPTHGDTTMTPEEEAKLRGTVLAEERQRVSDIEATVEPPAGGWGADAVKVADLRAKAIKADLSLDALKDGVVSILRAARPQAPNAIIRGGDAPTREVLEANTLLAMGCVDLVAKMPDRVKECARRPRHALDLFVDFCYAAHIDPPSGKDNLIRAAASTNLATEIFQGVNNRIALDAFEARRPSILTLSLVKDLTDFRAVAVLRPRLSGKFYPVAGDGLLKHGSPAETDYGTIQADTYGEMFSLGRQDVINDSLGVIPGLIRGLVTEGVRSIDDVGWGVFLGNAGSFFSAAHGNYIEGASTVLSITALTAAIKAFRSQTDPDGKPLSIVPRFLVLPPALEMVGLTILNSVELARSTATDGQLPTGNPMKGLLDPLVEARCGNSKFTGYSDLAWYVTAAAAEAPMFAGFLNGVAAPTVEPVATPADFLGMCWRAYVDFAFAYGEPRACLKSKGGA